MSSFVIIDSRVQNIPSLLKGLAEDTRVVILDNSRDGIEQITAALDDISDLSAIHIISHGSEGTLYLGATTLTTANLTHYQAQLAGIGSSLTDTGDILLYGCDLASGDAGQGFIQQLAVFTGADVAASTNLTGGVAAGGDWVLEYSAGAIEAQLLMNSEIVANYSNVLAVGRASASDIYDARTLSALAYDSSDQLAPNLNGTGWTALRQNQLPAPTDLSSSIPWSHYFGGNTGLVFDNDFGGQAFVAINNNGTLAISFRGSSEFVDYLYDLVGGTSSFRPQYDHFHYLLESLDKYIADNHIARVLVTGHSLGGAIAEWFMADHHDSSQTQYVGITFGSPGDATLDGILDSRLLNFGHRQDPVFNAAEDWVMRPNDIAVDLTGVSGYTQTADGLIQFITGDKSIHDIDWSYFVTAQALWDSPLPLFDLFIANPTHYHIVVGGVNSDDYLAGTVNAADFILGQGGNDQLFGVSGNDLLSGGNGDDRLTGGFGNDTIDGGANGAAGDVVIFSNARSNYSVSSSSNGVTTVRALRGDDTDTVTNVEYFQFGSDPKVSLSQVDDSTTFVTPMATPIPTLAPAPTPPPAPPPGSLPVIYASDFSLTEGDSGTTNKDVRVYLTTPSSTSVTFNYVVISPESVGWAKAGSDFEYSEGALTILAGSTYTDISIPVVGDTDVEGDESLWVLLSGANGANLLDSQVIYTINGTIRDDDAPTSPPDPSPPSTPPGPIYLQLVASDTGLVEGPDGVVTEFQFDAIRSGDLRVRTKITYEVQGYGADPASADDFVGGAFPTANHVMDPDETTDSFTVRVQGDLTNEPNESFRVKLIAASPGVQVTDATAMATIRNDDGTTPPPSAGSVFVSIRPYDAVNAEGTSPDGITPFVFELTRNGDLSQETQVRVSIGTAGTTPQATLSSPSDFNSWNYTTYGYTATFAIDSDTTYVTFSAMQDSVNEPDEPFQVVLSQQTGYSNVVFVNQYTVGTILNDDGPAPPLVTAPSIAVHETDGNQTVNLRVQLSAATTVPVSMDYEVYAYASSDAPTTAGVDFTPVTGSISIQPGSTFIDIPVTILGDDLAERIELVDVRFTNLVNGYFGRSLNNWNTSIVVLDDDGGVSWPGDGSLSTADYIDLGHVTPYSLQKVSYWLDQTVTQQIFKFVVDEPLGIRTRDFRVPSFVFSSDGTLIRSGASRVSGIEDVLNGGVVFDSGAYFLVSSGAANGTGSSRSFELHGVPTPDLLPLIYLDHLFTNNRRDAGVEGGGTFWRVGLSQPVEHDVTFDIELRNLSAISGVDFFVPGQTAALTIRAGENFNPATFIDFRQDSQFEGDEYFDLVVKNVSGAVLPNGQSEMSSTFTVVDDDPSPVPVFVVKALTADRAEGSVTNGEFVFEISRPYGGSDVAGSVDWAVTGAGANQATANDFVGGAFSYGTLTIAAGEVSKSLVIEVSPDIVAELDESFKVELSNPSSGFEVFNGNVLGTILNDDGVYVSGYLGDNEVEAAISYEMTAEETTFLASGVAAVDVVGNALANHIFGNNAANWIEGGAGDDLITGEDGNDTLDGGSGADELEGGKGDDTYYVDSPYDNLFELSDAGVDVVYATADHVLSPCVENLILTGTLGIFGIGNDLANTIVGNSAANSLKGELGNDTLDGGAGDDILDGGDGSDTAVFAITAAQATLTQDASGWTVQSPQGTDRLINIEFAQFTDQTIALPANASPSGSVALTGEAIEDQTLTADTSGISDADSPSGITTFSYQWQRSTDGNTWNDIASATAGTYSLGDTDVGKFLRVVVGYTDGREIAESVTSGATGAVANGNHAPTVTNDLADESATEDSAFSFTVPADAFADVDAGDTLSYSATKADGTALPAWLAFNASTRTFSGTPTNSDVGSLDIQVSATDGANASVSDAFAITVANTNDAPTLANALADQSATEDSAFSFTVPANAFADVDAGDTLSYSTTKADGTPLPTWLAFNTSTRTFSGTPTNINVGSLDVGVTATDGSNASASNSFTITVANTNDAPTLANAIADQTATEDAAFSFTVAANAFADVDAGDSLSYTATLESGAVLPSWLAFNTTTRTFSGTPGASDIGTIDIKVTATDAGNAAATDVFALAVSTGKTVDFLAYDWKAHTLLDGVSITAGTTATQTTDADGSTSFTGITDASLALSAERAVPAAETALTDQAVNLQDAIAILKMIVGLEVNGADKALSPYQAFAADYDGDGQVQLTDAIGVLKHVVGLTAPEPAWHFASETDTSIPHLAALSPGAAPAISVDLSASTSPVHVGLVAYLSGDVDGSFAGASDNQNLDDLQPGYFTTLTQGHGLDPAQFGVYS